MAQTDVTYEQLATAFQHKNYKPLYFLYGGETFLLHELQHLLLENALEPHERDFNFDLIYGSDTNGATALSYCNAYPMMAERRVVVIRDFEKMAQNAAFAEYAKRPNPDAVVMLICSTKPNLTNNPYRALKTHGVAVEIKPLKESQIPGWIQQRMKKTGYVLRPDAAQMLTDFSGNNLQTLATELEKLKAYVGNRSEITREDVLDVGGHAREFNVFELQRVVGNSDFVSAARIVEHMLQQKTNKAGEALMMVSVLNGYFSKMWKLTGCQRVNLSEKQMAEKTGLNTYFIKEYLNSLKRYPEARIQRVMGALLAADYELKGGSTRDPDLILHLLLRRLAA